jgi:hypothetical protein
VLDYTKCLRAGANGRSSRIIYHFSFVIFHLVISADLEVLMVREISVMNNVGRDSSQCIAYIRRSTSSSWMKNDQMKNVK